MDQTRPRRSRGDSPHTSTMTMDPHTIRELALTAFAIVGTLACVVALYGLAQWIAEQRRHAVRAVARDARLERLLDGREARFERYLAWEMRERARVPVSRVRVVGGLDDPKDVGPLSRRGADLAADVDLLSHPEHAPVTVRSEDLA